MRSLPTLPATVVAGALAVAGLTAITTSSTSAAEATPRPIIALSSNGLTLVESTTAAPGTTTSVPIVAAGLGVGETLVGVAFRPADGLLYTLGVNAAADNATLYTVVPTTGVLTRVGAANGLIAWTNDGVTAVDFMDPATTGYGIDVNPTVDRIRLVATKGAESINARINPISGTPIDGDSGGTAGSNPGVNPDGTSARMATASYTNAQAATGGVTTEYALLPNENTLARIGTPNSGVATSQKDVLLSGAGLNFDTLAGLDIPSNVVVGASSAEAMGTAYAVLTVGGVTGTYSIDLATGAASLLATSPVGLRAIAVGELLPPVVTPTPTPTPAAAPATVTTGKATQQKKTVVTGTTLTCPAGAPAACTATVTLSVKVKKNGKKKTVTIGSSSTTVAKGASAPLSVKLNGKGKKLLKASKTLKATITTTAPTGANGAKVTTTSKITLKAKKL